MKKILTLFLLFGLYQAQAQTPTWSGDIAQIIYDNCGVCHHPGGLAPFSLLTYNDAFGMRSMIQSDVNNRIMPPWPPDDSYQDYSHKRSLTATEITKINDWVNAGAPEGNASQTPPAPSYNQGSFLPNPDLVLRAPVYTSNAQPGRDDYVCFAIPAGIATNKKIKAIEVVPGNQSIVHHCLVYANLAGTYTTNTSGTCSGPSSDPLIAGYAPGEFPTIFPNNQQVKMGFEITPTTKLVLAMHYPQGSQGQIDSTKIHLFFYDDTVTNVRTVSAAPALNNTSFCINANTVGTVSATFPPSSPLPIDLTLISVFPHAHLLGQDFTVYGLKLNGDTIPLIRIPRWDFNWQGFYLFKNPIKMPVGSRLFGRARYDNTTNNPFNPNNPPQNVCFGLNTTDEMFLVYFQYLNYQAGDENLDLESMTQPPSTPTNVYEEAIGKNYLLAYPNPFTQELSIEYYVEKEEEVSIAIYDIHGRFVKRLISSELQRGNQRIIWKGDSELGNTLESGMYVIQLLVGNEITTQKALLQR